MTYYRSMDEFDENINELGGSDFIGIDNYSSAFPRLFPIDLSSDDPITSIKHSILILWQETVFAYGYGLSQMSIMGCRAVAEKVLRVSYHRMTGKVLDRGTLGFIIRECNQVNVDNKVIVLAQQIKEFGDDRAHSNLERTDPAMANLGGESREVEILTLNKNLIHPYKGNARQAILSARDLLGIEFG